MERFWEIFGIIVYIFIALVLIIEGADILMAIFWPFVVFITLIVICCLI